MMERRPRAPVLRSIALRAIAPSASSASVRSIEFHLEQPLVLLDQRVLRLDQDLLEGRLIEILERRYDRQTTHEFRDQAVLQQILRLDLAEDFTLLAIFRGHDLGAEADRCGPPTRRNDFFKPGKGPTADEQNIRRIDLQELLLGMLAPALRRHGSNRPFHDLQKRLLDALARHVAGDRGIVGFARNLVDLVDIHNAALSALDVIVGRLQQLQDDVLDVLADVAGLGQASSRPPS